MAGPGETDLFVEQQEMTAMVVENDLVLDPASIEIVVYVPQAP